MRLPLALSLAAISSCWGEPVSTVLDSQGHATCRYKIDAVFPEGLLVRVDGKTVWLDVPYARTNLRNAIAQNQNKPPLPTSAAVQSAPLSTPQGDPRPSKVSFPVSTQASGFTFDLHSARRSEAVAAKSIRQAQGNAELDEAVLRIPGADSGKELPWEFVTNEVSMWMIWFSTADESKPENAAVNQYILWQNTPQMLLYRLLIKPWMPRHKKE